MCVFLHAYFWVNLIEGYVRYHWRHPHFTEVGAKHSSDRKMAMVSWGSRWHAIKGADLFCHWLLKFAISRVQLNTWRLLGKCDSSDWATFPQFLLGYGIWPFLSDADVLFVMLSPQLMVLWNIVYGVKPYSVWKLKLVWYCKTDLSGTASCPDYSAPKFIHLSWLSLTF